MASAMDDETAKPPQLLAIGFIQDAEAYVDSARTLDNLTGAPARFFPPIYFLLCQAIELTLKAHLAASGVPNSTLRNDIGHDLELAFQSPRDLGFNPDDARLLELVHWLSPFHVDHSFRYRKSRGRVQLPAASESAEIIGNTIAQVEPYVRRQFLNMRSRAARPSSPKIEAK
jgi:hypothetical protein